jgi:hypothetical protein
MARLLELIQVLCYFGFPEQMQRRLDTAIGVGKETGRKRKDETNTKE